MYLGIEHTKKAILQLSDVAVLVVGIVKRGVTIGDLLSAAGTLAEIKKLFADFPTVLAEAKDLDPVEMAQLAQAATDAVTKVMAAVKK